VSVAPHRRRLLRGRGSRIYVELLLDALLEYVEVPLVACARDGCVTHVNSHAHELLRCKRLVGTGPGVWVAALRPRTATGLPMPLEDLPPLRALDGEHVRRVPILVSLRGRDLLLEVGATPLIDSRMRRRGALVSLSVLSGAPT